MNSDKIEETQQPADAPGDTTQSHRQEVKREVLEFVKMVVWFVVLFVALRTYVIEGYEVQGPSMEPTLHADERILVFKLNHNLSKLSWLSGLNAVETGDVVVFRSPDDKTKRFVKRVVARGPKGHSPGTVQAEGEAPVDTVEVLLDKKDIYVNSNRIEQDYIAPDVLTEEERREFELEPGEFFVLGDNRGVSKDSRSFGPVDDDLVIGKAVLRFWPLHRFSLLK